MWEITKEAYQSECTRASLQRDEQGAETGQFQDQLRYVAKEFGEAATQDARTQVELATQTLRAAHHNILAQTHHEANVATNRAQASSLHIG